MPPAIVVALLSFLAQMLSSMVGRILIALGIQYMSYKGVDVVITAALNQAQTSFSGLPADIFGMVGLLRIPEGLSVLAGAITVVLTMNGLKNSVITKAVHK